MIKIMKKRIPILKYTAMILLGIYFSTVFTNIVSPKVQLFIDTAKISSDQSVQIFLYDRNYTEVFPDENGYYKYHADIYGNTYNLSFKMEASGFNSLEVQGRGYYETEKISNYTSYGLYEDLYCVKLNAVSRWHSFIFIAYSILFLLLFYYIATKEIFAGGKYTHTLTYSNTAFLHIGWKPVSISIMVAVASLAIYYGCDLNVLSETIVLYEKGIDFFQMFAAVNDYKQAGLLMWQYDGPMLAGYNLVSYLGYPFLRFFHPNQYHWIYAACYKLFNMVLYNLLVLSVISYLVDHGFISENKIKTVYYWSVFNPLTFYVAVLFIQFDMLPAYCITLGVLLLHNLKDKKVLAAMLLAYGISCKMTMFLLIPMLVFLIVFVMYKESRQIRKQKLCFLAALCILLTVFLLLPRAAATPLSIALGHLAQAERIWFTTIQYAPEIFLFVAVFGLAVMHIFNICSVSLRVNEGRMIINTLYFIGAVVLVFSSATLATPAFFLETIPAFIIFYAEADDHFQSLWFGMFGMLIAANMMFMPEGDITASLLFFGKQPFFTSIKNTMDILGEGIKWNSFLHTISSSAMFAYAVIFARRGKLFLRSTEEKQGGIVNG